MLAIKYKNTELIEQIDYLFHRRKRKTLIFSSVAIKRTDLLQCVNELSLIIVICSGTLDGAE